MSAWCGALEHEPLLDVGPAHRAIVVVDRHEHRVALAGQHERQAAGLLVGVHRIAELPGEDREGRRVVDDRATDPHRHPAPGSSVGCAPPARRPSCEMVSSASRSRVSQAACSSSPRR